MPSSSRVNTKIRITGISDHDRLEWLIRINRIPDIRLTTEAGRRRDGCFQACSIEKLTCPADGSAGIIDPNQPQIRIPRKVLKGRAPIYCRRYHPADITP
jgi:hypothetical protein